jgi:hypothetical protein
MLIPHAVVDRLKPRMVCIRQSNLMGTALQYQYKTADWGVQNMDGYGNYKADWAWTG